MSTGFRKQISCLLAILLVLVPFASLHGFSGHTGGATDMVTAMQGQGGMDHCKQGVHDGCPGHAEQNAVDDNCCSDHCDACCGVHSCPGGEMTLVFVNNRVYSLFKRPFIPDPLSFSLLRPPSTIS